MNLQKAENNSLVKLSKLNEVAVTPKPIERQNVDISLRVFCDRTNVALESHPHVVEQSAVGPILFIKVILKVQKILMSEVLMKTHKLQFILDVAAMANDMKPISNPRCRTFTKDTASFVAHICNMLDLTCYMLASRSSYLILLATCLQKKAVTLCLVGFPRTQ